MSTGMSRADWLAHVSSLPVVSVRFLAKTKRSVGGCLEWTGSRHVQTHYGLFWRNGRNELAHRQAWLIFVGEIPEGLCVLHRCDNRRCVDVNHLFLGTRTDNHKDMVMKGRMVVPNLKLNPDIVREIRASGENQPTTARRFGVTQSTVSHIRLRRHWKNVA